MTEQRIAYCIRGWDQYFETSESRKRKGPLVWVAMPTRHDGKRFRRVARHEQAVEIFTAWCLIVQVAARCPERGTLIDEHGKPLDPNDFEDLTGFPAKIFDLALKELQDPRIGWIETITIPESADVPTEVNPICHSLGRTKLDLPDSQQTPATSSPTVQDITRQDITLLRDQETRKRANRTKAKLKTTSKANPDDAEAIYDAYPRKRDKRRAIEVIRKALDRIRTGEDKPSNHTGTWPPDNPATWLLERTKQFAQSDDGQRGQYTKHPATWFNAAGYADDPVQWTRQEDENRPSGLSGSGLAECGPVDPDDERLAYLDEQGVA